MKTEHLPARLQALKHDFEQLAVGSFVVLGSKGRIHHHSVEKHMELGIHRQQVTIYDLYRVSELIVFKVLTRCLEGWLVNVKGHDLGWIEVSSCDAVHACSTAKIANGFPTDSLMIKF